MSIGWKFAHCGCGNTARFRKDCPVRLGELVNIKKIEKEVKRANMEIRKVRKVGVIVRMEEGRNSGWM